MNTITMLSLQKATRSASTDELLIIGAILIGACVLMLYATFRAIKGK